MGTSAQPIQMSESDLDKLIASTTTSGGPPGGVTPREGHSRFTAGSLRRIANANVEATPEETGDSAGGGEDIAGLGLRAYQGLSLGAGKHIIAALDALPDVVRGRTRGAYSRALTDVQGVLDEADQQHPVLSPVTELAGSVPTMFAGGGSAPVTRLISATREAVPWTTRAARLAKMSAEGAGYAGTAMGLEAMRPGATAQDVAEQTGYGAATGAVVAPILGTLAGKVAERLRVRREALNSPRTGQIQRGLEQTRDATAGPLYRQAEAEAAAAGDPLKYRPEIQQFLEKPNVAPEVEAIQRLEGAPRTGSFEFLQSLLKRFSNAERIKDSALDKAVASGMLTDKAAESLRDQRRNAQLLKRQLESLLTDPFERPPIYDEVPLPSGTVTPGVGAASGTSARGAEIASLPREPQTMLPERPSIEGPAKVPGHTMDLTDEQKNLLNYLLRTEAARKAHAEGHGQEFIDAMLRQVRELEPPVVYGAGEFRMAAQGERVTPGVEIGPAEQVPSRLPAPEQGGKFTGLEPTGGEAPTTMRVQTAPAEPAKPYAPTLRDARKAYGVGATAVDEVTLGDKVMKEILSAGSGSSESQSSRGLDRFQRWLDDAPPNAPRSPEQIARVMQGMFGRAMPKVQAARFATLLDAISAGLVHSPTGTVVGHVMGGPAGAVIGGKLVPASKGVQAVEELVKLLPHDYQPQFRVVARALAAALATGEAVVKPTEPAPASRP